jgi:hypothetical protein
MGQAILALCTFVVFAFTCGFVGGGLGIAMSRVFRGEPGSSRLGTLLGTMAAIVFVTLVFILFFGTFGRPMVPGQMRLAGTLLALGLGIGAVAVIRMDYAAEVILTGWTGSLVAILGAIGSAFLNQSPNLPAVYMAATFLPCGFGLIMGWILAWRRDLDALLNGPKQAAEPASIGHFRPHYTSPS